jgi:hypothetical protein
LIITEVKPLEEILKFIEPYKKILVLGCDGCTQPPRGLKQAELYAELIKMQGQLKGKGYECTTGTISRQCDNKVVETNLPELFEGVDAVLSMACGCGPQTVTEVFPDKPVFPAQNTLFMGSDKMEEATYYEKCRGCGDCVLHSTGNICPITRCSKNILNGPCGGTTADGKCEVDPDTDCAWYLIYKHHEKNNLPIYSQYNPPRDWRPAGHCGPRKANRPDIDINYEEPEESESKEVKQ